MRLRSVSGTFSSVRALRSVRAFVMVNALAPVTDAVYCAAEEAVVTKRLKTLVSTACAKARPCWVANLVISATEDLEYSVSLRLTVTIWCLSTEIEMLFIVPPVPP